MYEPILEVDLAGVKLKLSNAIRNCPLCVNENCPHPSGSVSVLNTTYDTQTYSYWLARLIAAFVVERHLVTESTARLWLDDLAEAYAHDSYMFRSMAVVTWALLP